MLPASHHGAHSMAILFSFCLSLSFSLSCYGAHSTAAILCLTMEHTAWLPLQSHTWASPFPFPVCFYVEAFVAASVPYTSYVFSFLLEFE